MESALDFVAPHFLWRTGSTSPQNALGHGVLVRGTAVHPDPRRRQVEPDPVRSRRGVGLRACRHRRHDRVGELDEGRVREAPLQEFAEISVVLDEHEPVLRDAAADEGVRHGPRAGAELDDRSRHARVDEGRHGPREHAARRSDGAGEQRTFQPRTEEPALVLETLLDEQLARLGPLERLEHDRTSREILEPWALAVLNPSITVVKLTGSTEAVEELKAEELKAEELKAAVTSVRTRALNDGP